MENAYEVVHTSRMRNLKIFINELEYRISHMHKEFEILYVIRNPLVVTFPEKSFVIEEGEAVIINPREVHMLSKKGKASTFICLQFSPTMFRENYSQLSAMRFETGNIFQWENGEDMRRTIIRLSRLYQELDENENLEIISLFAHLLYLITNTVPHRMLSQREKDEEEKNIQRISRLLDFVEQGFTRKINLSDFAESEGLTLSYASHFAKKVLSEPFQNYVNSLRFNYAKQLLSSGKMSLAEAAFEAGFSDPRYLSRTFEKEMGIKASEFRKHTLETEEEGMRVHMSAHSMERYYSRRKSIELLDSLYKK